MKNYAKVIVPVIALAGVLGLGKLLIRKPVCEESRCGVTISYFRDGERQIYDKDTGLTFIDFHENGKYLDAAYGRDGTRFPIFEGRTRAESERLTADAREDFKNGRGGANAFLVDKYDKALAEFGNCPENVK